MSEQGLPQSEFPAAPESSPLQEAERRLAALMRPDPAETAELRAQQLDGVRQAVAQAKTPDMARSIQLVGDMYVWGNFGAHNEPLPPGMLYVTESDGRTSIRQDPRQFTTHYSFYQAMKALKDSQGRATLGLIQRYERKKGEMLGAIEATLKSTPWYGFLKSFDITQQSAPSERPLTHPEQLQRWAAGHQEVIRATGIDPLNAATLGRRPDESDTEANERFDAEADNLMDERFRLAKLFGQAELSTVHDQKNLPNDQAWEFAASYFFDLAVETLANYPYTLTRFPSDPAARAELLRQATSAVPDSASARQALQGAATAVHDYLSPSLEDHDSPLATYYADFFTYTISAILSRKDLDSMTGTSLGHMSYGDMLETMVRTFTYSTYSQLERNLSADHVMAVISSSTYKERLFNFIHDPQQITWTQLQEIEEGGTGTAAKARTDLIPADRIIELSGSAIGRVVHRTEPDPPWRLLMQDGSQRGGPLGQLTGREPLILELGNPYGADQRPSVPGYELVSHAGGTLFGFEPTDHDPYNIDEVVFSDGLRESMAHAITRARLPLSKLIAGLNSLNNPDFTMEDLEEALKAASRYRIPRQGADVHAVEALADFAPWFRRGRLDTQCVRSAHFGRLILAAGAIEAEIISGHSLPKYAGQAITEIGHAQVRTWRGDLSYILDATPSRRSFWQDTFTRAGRALLRETEYIPPPTKEPDMLATRQQIRTDLERTIADILGKPADDRLYDSIARLGQTHPLFKSWGLAVRATDYDDINHQELLEHIDYLAFLQADIPMAPRLSPAEKMVQLWHNDRLQRIIGELLVTTDPFA